MVLRFVNGGEVGVAQAPGIFEKFGVEEQLRWARPVEIRPYRRADREAIRRICCDTGFLGKPVDAIFQDRELFADLFTKPYLEHEPEWALVAEAEHRVVGYLLGSVSQQFETALMWSGFQTVMKMLFRLARGHYRGHPRSQRFIAWLLSAGMREQPRHPPRAAHLHFDLDRRYRGRGIGQRFWELFEERLREAGICRCYGSFFSHARRRPEWVYARFGFTVFDRRRTTLFAPEVLEPVDVVCVHKTI
jgi:ribosomal protein S18 acetylase RimI-like enzyme